MHPYGESRLADLVHEKILDLMIQMNRTDMYDRRRLDYLEKKIDRYIEWYRQILSDLYDKNKEKNKLI
jgi:hypothetical protein